MPNINSIYMHILYYVKEKCAYLVCVWIKGIEKSDQSSKQPAFAAINAFLFIMLI